MPRSQPVALAWVGLAIICVLLAVLYGMGAVQFLTSTGHGSHPDHAILFAVLAVGCLVLARFAWPRRAV